MGDAESGPIRLSFNPQLHVEFRGATVTSDAWRLLPRELDERLGLSALIERYLTDARTGRNSQFPLPNLFPPVDLQPPSGIRGYQRRRASGRESDVSDARLARAAGDERGAHLDAPLVQDRGLSRKSGTIAARARKSRRPTTATSSPSAIIPSSSSPRPATACVSFPVK